MSKELSVDVQIMVANGLPARDAAKVQAMISTGVWDKIESYYALGARDEETARINWRTFKPQPRLT